ncbi:3-hydroxyacyl-CoA dehydrogenase NAD-binding domain-containing protein [Thermoactinomyces sp. FSL K6-2592]|uniref:3-hydroxyacyl-CoA dehydrogenase NAD-binding domain-containing protein n=1 Tax=Thermoactinomyces sp. FSL K6-2592 TaxID=2975347 RepID=UPI0030F76F99
MTGYQIGVVGAGTMGSGIALVCAKKGHRVLLLDVDPTMLEKAKAYFQSVLSRDVMKGRISEEGKASVFRSVQFVQDLKKLADSDIVIEAVSERMDLKKSIFRSLSEICRPDALLLTNTSSLSITEIAGGLRNPERILGMHFFNPAPVMPLVEVVRGKKSGEKQAKFVYEFAQNLGKVPVYANDTPGFIVNRVARPYYNEALRILEDRVAGVEQIDRILTEAGGFKMGPFELQDLIGIDVNFAVTESVYSGFFHERRFQPSRIQQKMVQAGTIGRKSGEGYYDYDK